MGLRVRVGFTEVFLSYVAQFLQFASSVILFPAILKMLSSPEVGIWYVLVTIYSMVQLIDFGFQPTITRFISYVMAGANELCHEGITVEKLDQGVNLSLFEELLLSARRMYRMLAILVAVILSSFGTYYLFAVLQRNALEPKVFFPIWVIWIVFIALDVVFYYYPPVLGGMGLIKESRLLIITTQIVHLSLAYVLLTQGFGLLGVVLARLISTVVNRLLSEKVLSKKIAFIRSTTGRFCDHKKKNHDLRPVIWKSAYKLGIVTLGSFLINKANSIMIPMFLSINVVASYGITMQLFGVLLSFSNIVFGAYSPLLNMLSFAKDKDRLTKKFSEAYFVFIASYIFGSIVVLLFFERALAIVKSNVKPLAFSYMLFIALMMFLEANHSLFAGLITTKNEIPFTKPALISGGLIVTASFLLLRFTNLGLWGPLLAQFVVQLSYNNWKWPLVVLKELDVSLFQLFWTGMRRAVNFAKIATHSG